MRRKLAERIAAALMAWLLLSWYAAGQAWAASSKPTLLDHAVFWSSVAGAAALTRWAARRDRARRGPRSVAGGGILPDGCPVRLDELLVGVAKRSEQVGSLLNVHTTSYSATSHSSTGHVQSFHRTFKVFDFGYAVTNLSPHYQRVQLALAEVSPDGYIANPPRYSWLDLAPGGRQRAWFKLEMPDPVAFAALHLIEISVGLTPRNPNDGAHFEVVVRPQQTLYRLLGVDRTPLSKGFPMGFLSLCLMFVVFVLVAALVLGSLRAAAGAL